MNTAQTGNLKSTKPTDRFLPARANPLKIDLVTNIAFRFQTGTWESEIKRLEELNFRGTIVGLKGSGKSTLLRELNEQLLDREFQTHFVFIPNPADWHARQNQESFDSRATIRDAITASKRGEIVLIDGVERIGFLQKRKLLRQTVGRSLVITSHHRTQLPTWIHCKTDPDLMQHVLLDLGFDQQEIFVAGELAFEKSGGNIRVALRDLYDQFASGRFNKILPL